MIVWCISNWESYPFHLCFHMAMMWVGIHTWSTPVYLNTWTYFPACAYDCSAVYLWLTVHWAGTQPPLPEGPEPAWWPPQLSKPGRARWWPSLPRKEAEADLDVNANEGLAAHLASAVDAASRGRWESHSSWTVLSCKAHSPSPAHFFFYHSGVLTVRTGLEFKTPTECAIARWGPGPHLQWIISQWINSFTKWTV